MVLLQLFGIVVALICIYTVRHYCFTVNRVLGKQRHPYVDIDTAEWPEVTVFIAAHNEEAVIADCIQALLAVDYPETKLKIVPVNDRSTDRTREIAERSKRIRDEDQERLFRYAGGDARHDSATSASCDRVRNEVVTVAVALQGEEEAVRTGLPRVEAAGAEADVVSRRRAAGNTTLRRV